MTSELLVYCCPLTAVDDALLPAYRALLSADENRRCEDLRRDSVRKVFLVSRALVRTVLAARLRCRPEELQFVRDHNDKPQLHPRFSGWQFNLSHAGNWAVLALSNGGAVGVDVETHERRNNLSGIAGRFFSAAENRALAQIAEPEQWQQRFFELWTLKEAYVKALGRGIATALAGTDIEYLSATSIRLHLTDAARCDGRVRCWHYPLGANDSLALALIDAAPDASTPVPRLHRVVPLREAPREFALAPGLTGTTPD